MIFFKPESSFYSSKNNLLISHTISSTWYILFSVSIYCNLKVSLLIHRTFSDFFLTRSGFDLPQKNHLLNESKKETTDILTEATEVLRGKLVII